MIGMLPSLQDFSIHGLLIPNLYEVKSKIIEQRYITGTFSERSKKNTALKLSEIYNKGICGEKNSYVIFTHM